MNKYRFLLGVLICMCMFYIYTHNYSRVYVVAGMREWSVIRSYDNSNEAAELLNSVNVTMIMFFRYIKNKYHIDQTDDINENVDQTNAQTSDQTNAQTSDQTNAQTDAQMIVQNILINYNPDTFYENDPRYTSETSYTVNKGDSMYVCLRQKDDPTKLMDKDTTLFVMLHEVAHIGNYNGWGHDDRYWTVFKFILQEAVAAGIYTPIDYALQPKNYCGLKITYQPIDDKTLPPIIGAL